MEVAIFTPIQGIFTVRFLLYIMLKSQLNVMRFIIFMLLYHVKLRAYSSELPLVSLRQNPQATDNHHAIQEDQNHTGENPMALVAKFNVSGLALDRKF